jgi:uncharacterized protein involved in exopolysaccharide biosynthesis
MDQIHLVSPKTQVIGEYCTMLRRYQLPVIAAAVVTVVITVVAAVVSSSCV